MSYQQFRPTGFNILPPVVKNLLIINAIMFLASLVFKIRFHINLNDMLGLHYPSSTKFHWYQFITYMFMHEGWEHIIFNMFAVWTFGNVLENFWGPKRFIVFYIITALGAAVIQTIYTGYQLHVIDMAIANPDPESYLKLMNHYFESPGIHDIYTTWKQVPAQPEVISVALRDLNGLRAELGEVS
ncbi:MAG TPA: rhomboid family intramembrane serine protease, partial [Bacteroidia bacterium]|nr:rhomboid family intramembrane serine protease [Bacteroidia bacterium]